MMPPRPLSAVFLLLSACVPEGDDTSVDTDTVPVVPNPHGMDDALRVNHVQLRATHNSYHTRPDPVFHPSHAYEMPPLEEQAALHGIRGFELDLHWNTEDGVFDVFHLPAIDAGTTCQRLTDCLGALRRWSVANPWHAPLIVWMEPKDDLDNGALAHGPIDSSFEALDAEILSVWPREALLTPDDLRGDADDLPTAIADHGWPTLAEARGKLIVALLDSGEHRDGYTAGNPTLAGRILFADTSTPTDPWAAMVKDGSPEEVTAWAEQGFLVVANVDGVEPSAAENTARRDTYLAAGLHAAASDFPGASDEEAYTFELPGGAKAVCNPISAPEACTPADIEDPDVGGVLPE